MVHLSYMNRVQADVEEQPDQDQTEDARASAQRQYEQEAEDNRVVQQACLWQLWRVGLPEIARGGSQTEGTVRDSMPEVMIDIDQHAGRQGNPGIFFEPGQGNDCRRCRNLNMFLHAHIFISPRFIVFLILKLGESRDAFFSCHAAEYSGHNSGSQ